MNVFGRFEGTNVYKIDLQTYIKYEYYLDDEDMYLINDDLIYKNQIIGRWDGKHVHEWSPRERTTFYDYNFKEEEPVVEYIAETDEPVVNVEINLETIEAASAEELLAGVYAWQVG